MIWVVPDLRNTRVSTVNCLVLGHQPYPPTMIHLTETGKSTRYRLAADLLMRDLRIRLHC